MENGSLSAADVALLNGKGGSAFGTSGDAFMWIFALLILAGGGFGGWGNNGRGYQSVATQDFVQNGFDNQNLQAQTRDILSAVTSGTAQTVNAVTQAEYEQIGVAKDAQYQLAQGIASLNAQAQANMANQNQCCCNTLRAIDGVNYANAQNTAAINANTTAQTQKILDAIAGNRMADMQNQINQLQLQNAVAGVVRYPSASTYYAGNNPFCGCGCGINV